MTHLPGHEGKMTSDKKMICNSYQRCKGGNRDCCNHFLVIFERTSKFVIVFVRLISGKVGVDGFTRARQEIDVRYEFGMKVIVKGLALKKRF